MIFKKGTFYFLITWRSDVQFTKHEWTFDYSLDAIPEKNVCLGTWGISLDLWNISYDCDGRKQIETQQISEDASCSLVPYLFPLFPEEFHFGWSDRREKTPGGGRVWSLRSCLQGRWHCSPRKTTSTWLSKPGSLFRVNLSGIDGFLLLMAHRKGCNVKN